MLHQRSGVALIAAEHPWASALGTHDKGRNHMASGAKRKTTMAKLNRESKLRERRANKQAKKQMRKQTPLDQPGLDESATAEAQPDAGETALDADARP